MNDILAGLVVILAAGVLGTLVAIVGGRLMNWSGGRTWIYEHREEVPLVESSDLQADLAEKMRDPDFAAAWAELEAHAEDTVLLLDHAEAQLELTEPIFVATYQSNGRGVQPTKREQ